MVEKISFIKLKIINLFRSDYFLNIHIREMARLLNKSHVTLLSHINSLEKEKILNFKNIGRSKIYSLNLDNILTKNYLVLSEINESNMFLNEIFLIKRISMDIFNLNFSGSIILFGSYAKKTFNDESDIDLFYLGKINEIEIKKVKEIGKIYGKLINIKHLTLKNFELGLKKKDSLIIEIIKNHIIFQNAELFINILWRFYNEKK